MYTLLVALLILALIVMILPKLLIVIGIVILIYIIVWAYKKIKTNTENESKPKQESPSFELKISADKPEPTTEEVNAPEIKKTKTLESVWQSAELPAVYNDLRRKYHYNDVDICIIEDRHPDMHIVSGLMRNCELLELKCEPENQYDHDAVAFYSNDMHIGYLYRGKLQDMANDFLRSGNCVIGYLSSVDEENMKATAKIGFYCDKSQEIRCTLVGNSNEEMQDYISFMRTGDGVTIGYDFDGKWLVSSDVGEELGYLPSRLNDKMDEIELYSAKVLEVVEKDNGKYSIRITIKY